MPLVTHILFDFFGTLVTYVERLTGRQFSRSHDVVRSLGADLSYPEFLAAWSRASAHFEQLRAADQREHAMADIAQTFLGNALGRAPAASAQLRLPRLSASRVGDRRPHASSVPSRGRGVAVITHQRDPTAAGEL